MGAIHEQLVPPSSTDHLRNPRKKNMNTHPSVPSPYEKSSGRVFHAPPPSLSLSLPPSFSVSAFSTVPLRRSHSHTMQPPLLPLPLSRPYHINIIPPPSRRSNIDRATARDHHSLAPKKPKPSKSKQAHGLNLRSAPGSEASSSDRIGPDPARLPKDVSRVLSSLSGNNAAAAVGMEKTTFPGSLFIAPPSPSPSSLPLPKFPVRPKLGCRSDASAGIDAGATDDLRRLLRLR